MGSEMEGSFLFNVLSRQSFLRSQRFWRVHVPRLLALVVLAILARNRIADATIEYVGSIVLGNTVKVQQVEIGLTAIAIRGLQVQETSLGDVPQITIQSIHVTPTLWRGIRQGVWLDSIVVNQPVLHLRFDEEGTLLSKFPASGGESSASSEPLKLPLARAVVSEAAVVIHQSGKPSVSISGASLTLTADESIQLHAEVADLLGTQLCVESLVDGSTLAGRTTLTLTPLQLDTKHLAQLPLVPNTLADHPVTATVDVWLQMEHPANDLDLRNHTVDLQAKVSNVHSAEFGTITSGIDLRAIQRQGLASMTVQGPLSSGQLLINANVNLADSAPTASAFCKLVGVQLEPLVGIAAPGVSLGGVASLEGTAQAVWKDQALAFRGDLSPTLGEIQAEKIPVGDIVTRITCEGNFAQSQAAVGRHADSVHGQRRH